MMEGKNGILSLSVHEDLDEAIIFEAAFALAAFLHVSLLHAVLAADDTLASLADQLEIVGVAERTHGTDILL